MFTSSELMNKYKSKLITAEQAAQLVKNGDKISYGSFHTKPIDFDIALANRIAAGEITKLDICIVGTIPPVPQALVKMIEMSEKGDFKYNTSWFGVIERATAATGVPAFVPVQFQDVIKTRTEPLWHDSLRRDVAVIQCAPMDNFGNFNFGIVNAHTRRDLLNTPIKIVEVNQNFPVVYGGAEEHIHIDEIDYIIEGSNSEMFYLPEIEPTEVEVKIAQHIIPLIRDGACLQLGIGGVPNAIGKMIADSDLKDLGVHSEMFCDAFYDLYMCGKITNKRKVKDTGKSVFTFSLCTKKTMEFLHKNPLMASYNGEYVTEYSNIKAIDNMFAINATLEIDILGQATSETIGQTQYSGTGGALSFTWGAYESRGGTAVLCLPSTYTDKEGRLHSKIKASLTPGAVVTIPRSVISTVATEYGIANIKGLPLWARAEALINLAHPAFRDELVAEAEKMKIWRRSNKIEL
ncbi:Acyl-CoA hydrolase [Thermosyntropha lipolytica DSM 11003]|uniref:Acyl-CoA hydrolase n=1 Tax=Thermosyntropha lipolytica DSM 11003 TaxID=1123382 RepID=A0A1M5L965_9FIRM|nr:acetyl-CoA hydrolase/transferase C-terminal domain-containing protein [Thermosyntropha lipolytica]SHG61557.1 Acyl-CoA hydrolase [Thermosyntropha lipolytica DSM 11003]